MTFFQVYIISQQVMQKYESEKIEEQAYYFFVFINTKSGFGQGREYFEHNFSSIKYKFESNRIGHVTLIDLFNQQQKAKTLQKIKTLHDDCQPNIRIVISGGDGTILWVVNEIINAGIDPNQVVFAINPIGTGNDFSRSVGWGPNPLIRTGKFFKEQLAKQIHIWINAKVGRYDLWDVEIQTYPNGEIYDIKNQVEIRKEQRKLSKIFCNYVGMGLDARVVYTVQKKRTSNAFFNKIIYGLVGFCNFFRSLKTIDNLSFVSQSKSSLAQKLVTPRDTPRENDLSLLETDVSDIQQMMTTNLKSSYLHLNQKQQTVYKIKKGYRGLVCLNCPSYMCGLRDVWKTPKIAQMKSSQQCFKKQGFDDGCLEFVAYKNQLQLALQRVVRSGAKFSQGAGPFRYELPKAVTKSEQTNYIQIDGQSIKVMNLKQIHIQKTTRIKGSQLNILVNSANI